VLRARFSLYGVHRFGLAESVDSDGIASTYRLRISTCTDGGVYIVCAERPWESNRNSNLSALDRRRIFGRCECDSARGIVRA
jgi:hypothetical protein